MSDPLGSGIVGFATSEKGVESGWSRGQADEQFFQRLARNLVQIDRQLHNQWAANERRHLGLKFAYFGGVIDTGVDWTVVAASEITLTDDAVNYIERSDAGVVTANTLGFTYPDWIPMAEVTTRGGEIIEVIDRRPEIGGAPTGGGGGTITFPMIVGVILDSQVPLTAVQQWEGFLSIAFTQLTGQIADAQVPESAVTQHEGALSISFTQMTDQILDSQVPESAVLQWLPSYGGVEFGDLLGWITAHVADETHRHLFNVACFR
jgi:hypothetical protein